MLIILYQAMVIFKMNSEKGVITSSILPPKNDSIKDINTLSEYLAGESVPLNNPRVYFGNDTVHSFKLFNNNRKGKYLVFRFSGLFCDKCIDDLMNRIRQTFPDLAENNKIILLCSEVNPRMKEDYYGKKLLSYQSGDMNLPLEKVSIPFFFIIDESRISKLVFVPDISKPSLTDYYLRIIKHRFFLNQL